MWPFATYGERGVEQAFGTDSPITAVTSMDVLYCAVTRQDPFTHEPAGGWLPRRADLCIRRAAHLHGRGSAAAAGREDELGQIAPGMLADFVVLDRDVTACDPDQIQLGEGARHLRGRPSGLRAVGGPSTLACPDPLPIICMAIAPRPRIAWRALLNRERRGRPMAAAQRFRIPVAAHLNKTSYCYV